MFNSKVSLQTNDSDIARANLATLTKHGVQDDVRCHLKAQYCSSLCSMFVPGYVLDRKTPEDRYFIYTPYCLLVEDTHVRTN